MAEYRVADPAGTYAEQVAWEDLLDVAAEYREADEAGRRDVAHTVYVGATGEFGDEVFDAAVEYVRRPEVQHAGEPGYVGGPQ